MHIYYVYYDIREKQIIVPCYISMSEGRIIFKSKIIKSLINSKNINGSQLAEELASAEVQSGR